jgi:hypothetical protein
VVGVGTVNNDICLRCFLGEKLGAIQIAVNESDFGVLGCYFGAFVAISNQGGYAKVRVGVGYIIECIAADIASSSCSMGC